MRTIVTVPKDEDLLDILLSNGWIKPKPDGLGYIYGMRSFKTPWSPTRVLKLLAPIFGYKFKWERAPNKGTTLHRALDRVTEEYNIEWPTPQRGGDRYVPDRVTKVDLMLERLGVTDRSVIPPKAMKTVTSRWFRIQTRVRDKEKSIAGLIERTRAKFPDAFIPKEDPVSAFKKGMESLTSFCHLAGV